jgi:hypothetical protein
MRASKPAPSRRTMVGSTLSNSPSGVFSPIQIDDDYNPMTAKAAKRFLSGVLEGEPVSISLTNDCEAAL